MMWIIKRLRGSFLEPMSHPRERSLRKPSNKSLMIHGFNPSRTRSALRNLHYPISAPEIYSGEITRNTSSISPRPSVETVRVRSREAWPPFRYPFRPSSRHRRLPRLLPPRDGSKNAAFRSSVCLLITKTSKASPNGS